MAAQAEESSADIRADLAVGGLRRALDGPLPDPARARPDGRGASGAGRSVRDTSLDDWQRSAEANLGTIDADRLLAAILLRRLSAGILPRDEVASLAALEEQATERARRSPRSALWCHLAVPPLFTAVAWGWTALGHSDRAIELLNARRRRALGPATTMPRTPR